jgi:hypothetical protein
LELTSFFYLQFFNSETKVVYECSLKKFCGENVGQPYLPHAVDFGKSYEDSEELV